MLWNTISQKCRSLPAPPIGVTIFDLQVGNMRVGYSLVLHSISISARKHFLFYTLFPWINLKFRMWEIWSVNWAILLFFFSVPAFEMFWQQVSLVVILLWFGALWIKYYVRFPARGLTILNLDCKVFPTTKHKFPRVFKWAYQFSMQTLVSGKPEYDDSPSTE
jgi:hypothetical protein